MISKASVVPSEHLGAFKQRVDLRPIKLAWCHGCADQGKFRLAQAVLVDERDVGMIDGYAIGTDAGVDTCLCRRCAVDLALRILEAESL